MRNKMVTITFLAFIIVFTVGSIIAKDRDFSHMENRYLDKFPEVSAEALANGEFTANFEAYMSDQIIFKDFLVKIKVAENLVLNQKLINDVYFAEDMLIQNYKNPYAQLGTNISYINEFVSVNENLNCTWLLVPNASYVYKDKLPLYGECYNQDEVLAYIYGNVSEKIRVTDCFEELKTKKSNYIYYTTDHHWTMEGAYTGYETYCEFVGLEPTPVEQYEIEVGSESFFGSLYSKAPTFTQNPDELLLYKNPKGEYTVSYEDENIESDSMYTMENLEIKDKYTVYLDGNHAILRILSNAAACTEEKCTHKLLVVKDSYAHSLLPLLADHYSEIIVVDLRYYHESVSKLAIENEIEDVLFINNIEFISTDNNFLWLY